MAYDAGRLREQAGRCHRRWVQRRADRAGCGGPSGGADGVSANWCTPLNNAPITPEEHEWLRADFESIRKTLNTSAAGFLQIPSDRATFDDSKEGRRAFYETMWTSRGFTKLISNYKDLLFDEAANAAWCDFVAEKIQAMVDDPQTAAKLIPTNHGYGAHRPHFSTEHMREVGGPDYFEAYNKPSVSLVDLTETPMVRVTDGGIETSVGLREFDIIVWATGFDFGTGALLRMGIRGRDGLRLTDHWVDGPTTFLGVQTTRFPNLFFPGGPHGAAGNNPRYNGDQVDFITDLLDYARHHGHDRIEVDQAAEEDWTGLIDRGASRKPAFSVSSYYFGSNIPGKPRKYLLNSAGRPKLLQLMSEVIDDDYKVFKLSRSTANR